MFRAAAISSGGIVSTPTLMARAPPHHPHDEQANPGDQVHRPRRTRLFLIPNDPGRL